QMHAARVESQEAQAEQSSGLADKYTALLSQALDCMSEGGELIAEWQAHGISSEQQQALADCMGRLGDTAADASYPEVAALAKALAGLYQRSIAGLQPVGEAFFALANKGHDELDDMMDIIAAQQVVEPADALIAELDAGIAETPERQAAAETPAPAPAAPQAASQMAGLAIVDFARQLEAADAELLEIFAEEAGELAESLEPLVADWLQQRGSHGPLDEMKRILHTLKGGARLAELSVLGDLTHDYESLLEKTEVSGRFDEAFFEQVAAFQARLMQLVDFALGGGNLDQAEALAARWGAEAPQPLEAPQPVAEPVDELPVAAMAVDDSEAGTETETETETAGQPEPPAAPAVAESVAENAMPTAAGLMQSLADEYRNADADTLEIFLEEATELAAEMESCGSEWLADRERSDHADALKRILHTIKGGARMAELPTLGNVTHDYESMIESAEVHKAFDDAFFERMQNYQDQIQAMVEFVADGAQLADQPAAPAPVDEVLITALPETPAPAATVIAGPDEDFDPELMALFVEEAKEQNEGIEETIANFLKNKADPQPLEELKRLLHTLKGGARLAGVKAVGDLSHDFETFIINSEREGSLHDEAFVDGMQGFHEQLSQQIAGIVVNAAPAPAATVQQQAADSKVVPIRPDITTDAKGVSQAAIDATRNFIDNFRKEQQRSTREPIKIAPELLESLINLAGESIIGRSRIEEQISELRFSMEEMDMTVDRLHAQLRRLEIETEAQIVFRQEQVITEGQENFDPLEMDRYTHMQQLSKSLIEAASDIDDLSGTFNNKMRDMETLLLQQSRINSELQEGLMRCQMVPFSRMVPRLRRIVRQVAQELGKKVEFSVENAEGELDRSILERMIAPLEHMLRNAVDHGIEMPDVRKKAGKPETGSIVLALSREGGEVVLTLKDNGGGINLQAVRNKAIERGLLVEGAAISDHEVLQFILHAGFSTAQKVTQISGRGVGMDVVHSEIKQMGGSVEIQSQQGEGSSFIVRLPFTVSVNRALMVCIGNDTFAIPLNTIEGIVRVSPYELEAYYQPDAPLFEYAGQSYNLRYMGTLLHRAGAKIEEQTMPLPVILIRSSDYAMAVQVDRLLGSREIVVKSLGPQFGMVEGVSGATVLGDGSVVIILDMLALIRSDVSRGLLSEAAALAQENYVAPVEQKTTTVMVVDDSVTVRKVTSRLLERFGLDVVLAKDGLDAITQLQDMEVLPDVMLLDIEMPRMDGFEVVNR
ncbi:MAG TPA: Hpt domain-containing protein, partial [Pseudomonadales bacterium]